MPESEPQSPQDEDQLPEPQSPEGSQSSQSQPQSPQDDEHDEQPWKDNMELKIPLIQYKASKSARTITTQTIGIVTEQTLDQSDTQNNSLNQLTEESISKIIQELHQDPEFQNVFDEMDFSERFDIEDIRLENELLTW